MNTRRFVVPVLGLAALALAGIAYRFDPLFYFQILTLAMRNPLKTPFIDTAHIPALIDCWQKGVDVYVTAPCDPGGHRPMPYSPLWLRATFLPTDPSWLNWLGLGLDGAFFLSLSLLPVPRRRSGILAVTLATFSSVSIFALERGNMDLVMFLLIAVGGWFYCRNPPLRRIGYPFFTLAGLLKFYPFVLFLLFLRERLALFIVLCLAAFAAVGGFVLYFQAELIEMARNLPDPNYFSLSFGSRQLPFGLGTVLQGLVELAGLGNDPFVQSLNLPHSIPLALDVFAGLVLAVLAFAFRLATRAGFQSALAAMVPQERGFLVIGAALFCGCFFAGPNISYRGIHLLFVMPGVIALASQPRSNAVRILFRITAVVILLVMWGLMQQGLVVAVFGGSDLPMEGSTAIYLYWIARELAWWWVAAVLLAVLFCFVAQSSVWHVLPPRLRPRIARQVGLGTSTI